MITSTTKEKVTQLLNEWYLEIRSRRINNAERLKKEIDLKINKLKRETEEGLQDQNLLLYYSLLEFRYNYLINNLGLSKDSFDEIDSFEQPTDNFLTYYYHFFKGIHFNELGNFHLAKEYYDKAEGFLKYVPDQLEKAEFYFKLATFHYDTQQALESIKYATKAKDMYSNYNGYELNVAFCDNILGLSSMNLKEWALAEEHFTAAMDQFQKIDEEKFIIMVRHNLGWMYSTQNLSELAIRYLAEVVEKSPQHYKALYVKAKEHYKLKECESAAELIEKGLKICNDSHIEGYQHHFEILKALNQNVDVNTLENIILKGIEYFEREELYDYIQEYQEKLAIKFYEEDLSNEACKYFYLSSKTREKLFDKGTLK
uniref:response regulator aspartate phosphatase n=1 Tax=Bacillus multifaciens TaxID=3068506 RepID=UPI003F492018